MNETTVTVVGNLTEDPKLRRTEAGVDVLNFYLASNARRRDRETGEWVDAESLFLRVTCWRQLASNVMDSLRRGDPVVVTGRLFTRQFEVDGQRRSSFELEAAAIGHDLTRGVTVFRRTRRAGGPAWEAAPQPEEPEAPEVATDQPGGSDDTVADRRLAAAS
ncbi:MAG: single-stranded DNA-binding protein [Actinobacteria bacterium]|nr:single-stranded DNA-binding protein [Actinomycetota bacterium]MBI3688075.1 single-stranded DNA-binding protein [Actinomycetota bacterium]